MSAPMVRAAALRPFLRMEEIEAGIDQRHMREGLWKISEHAPRAGVVFFGQQTDIVRQT